MPDLKLVPAAEPPPAEKVRQRVKRMARPDGLLQCNRCGSRTILTTINGVAMKSGRKQGGTIIAKDVCAECWRRGVLVSMLPDLRPIEPSE